MPEYYDDNYGNWHDMDDPEMREFYFKTQRSNVRKKCVGCGRMVNIQPHYDVCDACATIRESGGDF